jgi:hypothetical protein
MQTNSIDPSAFGRSLEWEAGIDCNVARQAFYLVH